MPTSGLPRTFKSSWRLLVVVISLGLVFIFSLTTLFLSMNVNTQAVHISKNFMLRQQIRKVARLTRDVETIQRNYLLTLDSSYLTNYRVAAAALDQALLDTAALASDNKQHEALFKQVHELADREQNTTRQLIDLAQSGRAEEAIVKMRSEEEQIMEGLLNTLSQFIESEEQQLFESNQQVNQIRNWMAATSILMLVSALLLGFVFFSRVQRYTRRLFEGQSILLTEKELLERRVQERTAELEKQRAVAERERARVEVFLQDANHRIGNSLATVSSLLGLQMRQTNNEDTRAVLSAARDRVQIISSAHRRFRLGEDMETARADEFLFSVIEDIRKAIGRDQNISIETDFAPIDLNARDVTSIGIVMGELVINAIKHAFKGRKEGRIRVSLQSFEAQSPVLVVEDDGVGWRNQDGNQNSNKNGLGLLVVEQLCKQFGEQPVYSFAEGQSGTRVTIHLATLRPCEAV